VLLIVITDAVTDDLSAILPGLDVKVLGIVVVGDNNSEGALEQPPVFISDLHVIVKIVEMVKLSLEQRLVSEHGDDHVKTAEHSQSVSLELGGPDVVGVHAGEQGTGGGVLEEKFLPELSGEMLPFGVFGIDGGPLVLHLQAL